MHMIPGYLEVFQLPPDGVSTPFRCSAFFCCEQTWIVGAFDSALYPARRADLVDFSLEKSIIVKRFF